MLALSHRTMEQAQIMNNKKSHFAFIQRQLLFFMICQFSICSGLLCEMDDLLHTSLVEVNDRWANISNYQIIIKEK